MGMLDRYKKGNGILDLVKLVEDSGEPKRSQLLQMVRAEDPDFAAKVESKVISWEKIRGLPEGIFAEIVSATAPKFVAMVLVGEDPAFIGMVEKCLGKAFNEYRQERDNFKATPPTPSQIESAKRKMMAEARKLDTEGKIKLAVDEVVAQQPYVAAGTGAGGLGVNLPPVNTVIYGAQGAAKAEDPCPPVDSFKADLPPPGLTGERLETFFKSVLGF